MKDPIRLRDQPGSPQELADALAWLGDQAADDESLARIERELQSLPGAAAAGSVVRMRRLMPRKWAGWVSTAGVLVGLQLLPPQPSGHSPVARMRAAEPRQPEDVAQAERTSETDAFGPASAAQPLAASPTPYGRTMSSAALRNTAEAIDSARADRLSRSDSNLQLPRRTARAHVLNVGAVVRPPHSGSGSAQVSNVGAVVRPAHGSSGGAQVSNVGAAVRSAHGSSGSAQVSNVGAAVRSAHGSSGGAQVSNVGAALLTPRRRASAEPPRGASLQGSEARPRAPQHLQSVHEASQRNLTSERARSGRAAPAQSAEPSVDAPTPALRERSGRAAPAQSAEPSVDAPTPALPGERPQLQADASQKLLAQDAAPQAPQDEAGLLFRAKSTETRDPREALRLLEVHARYFPHGRYVEEREALIIRLHVRLGRSARAAQLAKRFRERFPQSLYDVTLPP